MSNWKIIVPEATTNEILNPSFEVNITDGWANVDTGAGAVFARSTTRAKFGIASGQITAGNNDAYFNADTITLQNNETLYAQVWIYTNTIGAARLLFRDTTTPASPAFTDNTTADAWELLQISWTNTTGGAVVVRVRLENIEGDGSTDVWFDAAQAEIDTTTFTTYCDGTQKGCEWNGAAHNSTSSRSAQSRAGGIVRDLKDFYGFGIDNFMATGMPPQSTEIDVFALLPGGELNDIKILSREFTLMGTLAVTKKGDCTLSLDDLRAELEEELAHDRYPQDADNWQPIIIRYVGSDVDKEIKAHYAGGLEGRIALENPNAKQEKLGIRFVAPDPNWYEIGESAQILDTTDTPTLRYIAGRLRSTGQWDDLALTGNPVVFTNVDAVVVGPDRRIYVGGRFQGWNNTVGAASIDGVAVFDPVARTWAMLGNAGDLSTNGLRGPRALAFGPDGILYAAGTFNVAAGEIADYLARWNGANWATVGVPVAGGAAIVSANALAFDSVGQLYIAGNFLIWANVALADAIVMWDGAAYNAVGGGSGGGAVDVQSIAIDSNDNIYVIGIFINWAGDADADRWAIFDGTTWTAVSDVALNNSSFASAMRSDNQLYVAGFFTNAGSNANADRVFLWNGQAVIALDTGLDNNCDESAIGPDGTLFLGGQFTQAGLLTSTEGLIRWNGSSFAYLDINVPGAPVDFAIGFGESDPVSPNTYDIFVAFNSTGVAAVAGTANVNNEGTAHAFPDFIVDRSGGTSALLKTLRNETIARELLYSYRLLDGEKLTTFNHPLVQDIQSSFYGQRLDATLAGDDFGDWSLQPGNNQVTAFVDVAGAPTIVSYLLFKDAYKGHSD